MPFGTPSTAYTMLKPGLGAPGPSGRLLPEACEVLFME